MNAKKSRDTAPRVFSCDDESPSLETGHCCKMMDMFLNDPRVGVYHDATKRLYTIKVVTTGSYQGINNCPWCGHEFLPDLVDEYFETLQNEYNIKDDEWRDTDELKELAPDEFKSDEWWKKRNL